jgi:hypothetical protein
MSEGDSDQREQPMATLLSLIAAVFTLGYMLPWMIAAARGKSNHWRVFWVNVLLGWTIVGWVAALVMSVRPHGIVGAEPL